MFMHHVHEQVHHYDLNENHIQGYVEALAKKDGQWQIQLNDNRVIHTDCVILANGCTHKPYILIFIKMLMMCATFSINHLIQLCMDIVLTL